MVLTNGTYIPSLINDCLSSSKCRYFLCPLNSAFNSSTNSLSASRNLKVKLLTGLKMADQNGLETKVSAALNCIDLSDPDIQKSAASLKQVNQYVL